MNQVLLGMALGFGAGIAPGPMLGLVITATLRAGLGAGLRLAVVPLLSDAPVVILSITAVASLPERVAASLAIAGGLFVVWLGVQSVREARTVELAPEPRTSTNPEPGTSTNPEPGTSTTLVRQGVLVNFLNPHPWLFWITVGGPLLVSAWRAGPLQGALFLASFYMLIVGTKAALALMVASARSRLSPVWYRRVLAGSGALLMATGLVLVVEFAAGLGG